MIRPTYIFIALGRSSTRYCTYPECKEPPGVRVELAPIGSERPSFSYLCAEHYELSREPWQPEIDEIRSEGRIERSVPEGAEIDDAR